MPPQELTFLAQAEPVVKTDWNVLPQLSPWLLGLFFVLSAAAAIYLYKAQRRVASRGAVVALTTIRTLLILLMFLVLLGPGCVFTRTGKSNGTLWLMIDQSQSMDRPDPQATPVEKLRWADALGLLPDGARPGALDRHAARLNVLRADVTYFQNLTAVPVEAKDHRKRVEEVVRGLKRWNSQLTGVADAVDVDPTVKDPVAPDANVSKTLRSTADTVARAIEKFDTRRKPEDTQHDLAWNDVRVAIGEAAGRLAEAADKADQAIVARNDPKVAEAINKVGKTTRAELAERAITQRRKTGSGTGGSGTGGFDELMPKQSVKVMGFGERPQAMIPEDPDKAKQTVRTALEKPAAPVTDVASGLQAIHDQVSQDEPVSVVLVSDGRQNRRDADSAEAVRRLTARGVRVYALALGTPQVAPDAAVETVDAPDWVFKGDTLKVTSLMRLDGLVGKTVTAELHRTRVAGGKPPAGGAEDTLIESREIKVDRERDTVSFAERKESLPEPGLYDYRVRIKAVPDEAVAANNSQTVRVSVKEDKLTVLMVEDQPRWEFRYVRSYLERDGRVRLQAMLLQPARIGWDPDPKRNIAPPPPRKPSTDEADGRTDFQVLPETQDEWYRWKFIVIGDVPPERLPKAQQEMIVKAVTDGGATLLVLSGPLNMPAAWGTSRQEHPLAALFPCEPSNEWTPARLQAHLKVGYHPVVAPDGEKHLLSQFGIDDEQTAQVWQTIGTDPNLAWYWHSEYTQARGGASVIWAIADGAAAGPAARPPPAASQANASPTTAPSDDPGKTTPLEFAQRRALLATLNAGLGKVMYMSGDASWRLRQVDGTNYHDRFWGQVIRWVVGGDLPAGGRFVRFGSDKPRYVGGEQATVTARIVNTDLVPQRGLKVRVRARALGPAGKTDPAAEAVVDADMTEVPDAPGQYRATLGNLPAGQVELTLRGPEVEKLLADDPTATHKALTVEAANALNLEQRNVNADHRALGSLTSIGGGVTVGGAYADVLAEHIPELNYTTTSAEQVSLFADPKERYTRTAHWAFLAVFVGLISAEWIIRKMSGLV